MARLRSQPRSTWVVVHHFIVGFSALLFWSCTPTLQTGSGEALMICEGYSVKGIAGTAKCNSSSVTNSTSSPAAAGDILATLEAWDASGTKLTGTMANRGSWNATTAFPGAGYYNAQTNSPTATSIVSGTTIMGVAGTAVKINGSTVNPAGNPNILATYEAWDGPFKALQAQPALPLATIFTRT